MATRIPAAFYGGIPTGVRSHIRQRVDDARNHPWGSRWSREIEKVIKEYGVSRVVVMRILSRDREQLALAYLYWLAHRD